MNNIRRRRGVSAFLATSILLTYLLTFSLSDNATDLAELGLLSEAFSAVYIKVFIHRRYNRRDQGRLVPQLLGWGPTMYWSPNFLAVVFKQQENLQQVVTRMQDLASEFSKIFRE